MSTKSKGTDLFKETIQNYLNDRAEKEPLFAKTLAKESKNIDECINYIISEVQKSGKNGFDDSEIFNMAVHYYDEDEIKDVKEVSAKVVVNHSVQSEEKKPKKKVEKKEIDPDNYPHPQLSMF